MYAHLDPCNPSYYLLWQQGIKIVLYLFVELKDPTYVSPLQSKAECPMMNERQLPGQINFTCTESVHCQDSGK